ncbi:MAG: phenylalanine--tRNA ligase subunit beta [bacterium]|jgi:phenylalanyl-tRNA synthetase beta chain|nr:phenylalanine--tRNA ligase subunit beta [bacterium]MDP6073601.1 phenylalanine--tRNA ligase subunit beta [Myxococcota bacterium]MDP6242636.1 phenylalanine--tRNA ligase subunit beta [Myxococcota bacterium]MDP7074225.1 phenylalanine--tRNA ligase subunit beta [Myxococcota bacterium]MDP7299768.1 phenylalanine--tRNA ligase subunit beta [Myxococcota bacterium]
MRLALAWLSEWIDLPAAAELVERLDMGGFEDTAVEDTGPDLSAMRVGHVVERTAHPNADRLSLCRVDLGEGDPVEIVCGAPNVAPGQKVAVASPGVTLPGGTRLKKTKIRGVVSRGMICSARELGLGDEHEGILVLDPGAPIGAPLPDVLAAGSRVLEVGITPNRGDTASLLGVAREVRALFGAEIREPETAPPETGAAAAGAARVSIEARSACHDYVARIVRGVRVQPSSQSVIERLEASGIRAINNVVDVTNLVLLEFGQPIHAFDLAALAGPEIRVRRAAAGEKLVTLDGETRELDPEDLVIADAERAIALAGVMGGADTEVGDATVDVLIESAHFHPTSVRLAARRHGLHTEASYRFERGVDRQGIQRAADRCARLMAELCGGSVAPGVVEARGDAPEVTEEVRLECRRTNGLLGTALSQDEMRALLERAGITSSVAEPGVLVGRVPSHRNDIHLHQDLTEEIARIYGYDQIPSTEPVGVLRPVEPAPARVLAECAKDALAGAGLVETVSFPFIAQAELDALGFPASDPRRTTLSLANPINDEEPRLRPMLLPTLLRLVRQNLARQLDRVAIFEVSRVFLPGNPGELPREPLQAAAVLTGDNAPDLWGGSAPPLFFSARGIVERLLNLLGYPVSLRREGSPGYLHPGAAATIWSGGAMLGAVGEVHPEVRAHLGIDVPCAALEVDLETLLTLEPAEAQFAEVSRFPMIRRDLAVIVDRDIAAGEILEALRGCAGKNCAAVELFDRYEGRGVPEGRVSLAFRLVFQRDDRTLTDAEVGPAIDKVVRMLSHRFGGELRQGGKERPSGGSVE